MVSPDMPEEIRMVSYTSENWLKIHVRCRALAAAARTTVDMDPEVTLRTAEDFESWIWRGMK